MWSLLVLWAVMQGERAALLRVSYDLQFFEGEQARHGKLTLNWLDDEHFSLHASANPAGGLFTFWATERENLLEVPRDRAWFSGAAEAVFALFPGGPELSRGDWLRLFREGRLEGDWTVVNSGEAYVLYSPEKKPLLRWAEKSRTKKTTYSERVLEPRRDPSYESYELARLVELWQH